MKKYVLFFVLIAIIAGLMISASCNTERSNSEMAQEAQNDGVNYLERFQDARDAKRPMLVLYTAPNCPACVEIKPAIDEIEKETEGKLEVIRFNIAEKQYSHLRTEKGIRAVPTIHFVDSEGNTTRELLGNQSKAVLMEEISKIVAGE
jgi:thiol-disulfide isomerase/thioredoxin